MLFSTYKKDDCQGWSNNEGHDDDESVLWAVVVDDIDVDAGGGGVEQGAVPGKAVDESLSDPESC